MADFVINEKYPHLGGNIRGGDSYTWGPILWKVLVAVFKPQSVADIGCGEGHALEYFYNVLNVNYAYGVDGLKENVDATNARKLACLKWDFTQGRIHLAEVDLVWTCEVAEHIPAEFVDNYLHALRVGKVIAMTHALPGQVGHHHVNCQPQEYWVNKLADTHTLYPNYLLFREISDCFWFKQSGLVFVRKD